MQTKGIDKTKHRIGLVVDIRENSQNQSGYELDMLIRRKKYTYPCTKEIHDYIDIGRFGHYPNCAEVFYVPLFDENGVVTQLMQADRFQNERHCLIDTSFGLATYQMMRYPLTEETPKVGEFIKMEGSIIRFASDFLERKNQLVYLECRGAVPEPGNKMMIKMADDFDIYTWDWSKAKRPFTTNITREEAIEANFVSAFEVGKPEDIEECYWIWFGSLRGDDDVLDTVQCFKNVPPGWTY